MIPKAFLSHSSKDKELVEEVAKELGRQQCVFDKYSFESGEEFRQAIKRGLSESSLFVLFASEHSLSSLWVEWEQQEAEQLKIYSHIRQGISFVIDGKTTTKQIAPWLRNTRILHQQNPKAIAREIRDCLSTHQKEQERRLFFGRTGDTAHLERALVPDLGPTPRCVIVWGLEGVGRRTLLDHAARTQLSLKRLLPIALEDGDELPEIASKLSAQIEQYRSDEELKSALKQITQETPDATLERIRRLLLTTIRSGELPVFIDEGGSLSIGRTPKNHFGQLLGIVAAEAEVYLGMVLQWRVTLSDTQRELVASHNVAALEAADMQRLLTALLSRAGLVVPRENVVDLAEFTGGYPPAAYFATRAAAQYGINSVLTDKNKLVSYRADKFARHLARTVSDDKERLAVASILAIYSPIPSALIAEALSIDNLKILGHIEYLIDCAIVRSDEIGWYRLANPVVDAVSRMSGHLKIDHRKIANGLSALLRDPPATHRLDLNRHLFRAQFYTGDASGEAGIHLRTDLVRIFKDYYHAERYGEAIKTGRQVIELYPANADHLETLGRALVRTEQYEEATTVVQKLQAMSAWKEATFLEGFSFRYQKKYDQAIACYQESIREKRGGVAIHRELASCYFNLNKFTEANYHIEEVLKKEPDNRFMLDLVVQIACAQNQEPRARAALTKLETLSERSFYLHRKSTTDATFDKLVDALQAAREVVMSAADPRFEWFAHLANLEIETQNVDEAKTVLEIIEERYPQRQSDVRFGLRCKLQIRTRDFEAALSTWARIRAKDLPVNQALRNEALRGSIQSTTLSIGERTRRTDEIRRIEQRLGDHQAPRFETAVEFEAVAEADPPGPEVRSDKD